LGRYWVKRLDEVPTIAAEERDDPVWYPLQHHFGLRAFGANLYEAARPGVELVGEHAEDESGQEELYLVISGRAQFELDGEAFEVEAQGVVAVGDPAVRRRAVALERGTRIVAVGAPPSGEFRTSWQLHHFQGVPRADG
jgi:hypothetical protein